MNNKKTEIRKIFGRNLRLLRYKAKMTQTELGEVLGISYPRRTISLYELGHHLPNLNRLKEIAKYFNIKIEKLFLEKTYKKGYLVNIADLIKWDER